MYRHRQHRRDSKRERKDREPDRWIRKLKARQEAKSTAKYKSTISTSSVRNGPIDTAIVGDSILKYVDQVRHSQVISYPGISCSELEQMIIRNKVRNLEGKKVILLHVGTNDLDKHWQETVYEITHLLVAVTDKYPSANVIWSNILPRPSATDNYTKDEVRRNIIKINQRIKRRQRHLKITTCPSHTSFHKAKYPKRKLFARDYLHLKPKGTLLLRELYRQHLLRLRKLWGMEVWEVKDLPDIETEIDRNWLNTLCNSRCNNN